MIIHLMGYNSIADNFIILICRHSFSCCWLPNLRNPVLITRVFEAIVGEGHPRLSILVSIESAFATSC